MKGRPAKTGSIMRLNVEPVLRKPKGMWRNSKRPKGTIMVVWEHIDLVVPLNEVGLGWRTHGSQPCCLWSLEFSGRHLGPPHTLFFIKNIILMPQFCHQLRGVHVTGRRGQGSEELSPSEVAKVVHLDQLVLQEPVGSSAGRVRSGMHSMQLSLRAWTTYNIWSRRRRCPSWQTGPPPGQTSRKPGFSRPAWRRWRWWSWWSHWRGRQQLGGGNQSGRRRSDKTRRLLLRPALIFLCGVSIWNLKPGCMCSCVAKWVGH